MKKCRYDGCSEVFEEALDRSLHEYRTHGFFDKDRTVIDKTGYGDNWVEARNAVINRDDCCQLCGDDGEHVHHIRKKSSFDTPEDSNTMDNLVYLCVDCHRNVEGMDESEQRELLGL